MLRKYTMLDADNKPSSVWLDDRQVTVVYQNGPRTSTIRIADGVAWRVEGMADDLASVINDGIES